jgi:hypothetical protein
LNMVEIVFEVGIVWFGRRDLSGRDRALFSERLGGIARDCGCAMGGDGGGMNAVRTPP